MGLLMFAKIDKDAKNTVVCKDSPQAELKFIFKFSFILVVAFEDSG